MTHLVDILLPTYNGEAFLNEQLDSLLQQTFTGWHLLLRDDGSEDATQSIFSAFQQKFPDRVRIIQDSEGNVGVTKSFSILAQASNAPYVAFCDQDDVWLPNKLEITLNKLRELENISAAPQPIMVFSDLEVVDNTLNPISESFWECQKLEPSIATRLYQILAQNVVTGCTMIINRQAKELCFPVACKNVLHDHWVAMNVCKYGINAYIERPLVKYRQHDINVLGAIKIGPAYYFVKTLDAIFHFGRYTEKYRCLPFDVNLPRVMINKVILNLKRLLL